MSRTSPGRTLSHAEARSFYDRFAWLQEWQGFYESPALNVLRREGDFSAAHAVLELGCGTGRFAEDLLAHDLDPGARFLGLDVSPTMVRRTRRRIARFGPRAEARVTDGTLALPVPAASSDRFVAAFVFDLLSERDIWLALDEAHRVLVPDGRLCLACLAPGTTRSSRALCRVWTGINGVAPALLGGCRPLDVVPLLTPPHWEISACETVVSFAVPIQVVVARARDPMR